MPRLFVFPHIEMLLLTCAVLPVAEAAGVLLGTGRTGPVIVGVILLALIGLYLWAVVAVCKLVIAHKDIFTEDRQERPVGVPLLCVYRLHMNCVWHRVHCPGSALHSIASF